MSWKTAFESHCLCWAGTHERQRFLKKGKTPFFQCDFLHQQEFGVYKFLYTNVSPIHNVFVIYNCNSLHFSETVTHEIQGHEAFIQKNAQDSVKIEKKQSLTLYVHIWWPKALIVNGCRSFYTDFTVPYTCSSLTTLKQGEALYMASREENILKIRINQALFACQLLYFFENHLQIAVRVKSCLLHLLPCRSLSERSSPAFLFNVWNLCFFLWLLTGYVHNT